MATTRLIPLHIGKGKTISTALGRTVDYVENPDKTNEGEFISSYECDPLIAEQQFLFTKSQYTALTGRNQGDRDIIAYHLKGRVLNPMKSHRKSQIKLVMILLCH